MSPSMRTMSSGVCSSPSAPGIADVPLELPAGDFGRDRDVGPPHLGVGPGVHLVDRDEQQRHRRQDRPHDFQRVAAVRELDRLADSCGVVLPDEVEQRDLRWR